MHLIEQKQAEEKLIIIANTVEAHMSCGGVQPMARALQNEEN